MIMDQIARDIREGTFPKKSETTLREEAREEAVEPPTELDNRRAMIKTAVEAAANGVMTDIKALRGQLDELETLVIQSAERNIESLNTHVGICESAQIEVNRLSGVVAEMRKGQLNGASP